MEEHMPYEGAGFILQYQKNIILGLRCKKPADFAKDPTQELEYMGGKPEKEDGNNPLKTAHNELMEEIGWNILDSDWHTRVRPIHIFQPFSKKWIWCCLLTINDNEFANLKRAAAGLDDTLIWGNSFQRWTGRPGKVERAIESIYQCPVSEVTRYMNGFKQVPNSGNRMTDAKKYREADKLKVTHLLSGEEHAFPLRAFNTVMWEEHVDKIVQ